MYERRRQAGPYCSFCIGHPLICPKYSYLKARLEFVPQRPILYPSEALLLFRIPSLSLYQDTMPRYNIYPGPYSDPSSHHYDQYRSRRATDRNNHHIMTPYSRKIYRRGRQRNFLTEDNLYRRDWDTGWESPYHGGAWSNSADVGSRGRRRAEEECVVM